MDDVPQKIGNVHSEFLSDFLAEFTQNYVKAAAGVMQLGIQPSAQLEPDDFLDKFARSRAQEKHGIKEEIFKFITTEANRDNHLCELILRKVENELKIKLTHYSGSFDYAAFQAIWHFGSSEEKMASKVFDTLSFTLNGIKQQHNTSQKHSVSLVPIIREAVKTVATSHQYKKKILYLDESDQQQGESNWQQTIYGNKYPSSEDSSKAVFSDNHPDQTVKRTMYIGRNKKITTET